MMSEQAVVDLLRTFEELDITVWIGGGWGVDALVGRQTRPHGDIDVYIEKKNGDGFMGALASKGYAETKTEYTTQAHTVWTNAQGHVVDLHLIEFKAGDTESLYFEGEAYPLFVLDGKGTIGGVGVKCFTAEAQLLFHQGYELGEKDVQDVKLLRETFGLM